MLLLLRFAGRRMVTALPMLAAVAVVTFLLVRLAPGDPVYVLAGEGGTPAYYALVRQRLGLDRPLPEQLARYLATLARGDLGWSLHQQRPVGALIVERLPATLVLAGAAFLLATAAGLGLGVWAAARAGSVVDRLLLVTATVGSSLPVFWTGLLLVLVFAWHLHWVPVQGMMAAPAPDTAAARVLDVLHHLVLPACALALQPLASVSRLMRLKLLEALAEPYIVTARAKGLSQGRVLAHAARNALLPVLTVMGGYAQMLVSGAVLTETVFAWPGLGRLALDATLTRDYPLILGLVLTGAASTVALHWLTDVLYGAIDPRITYG
ncbi:MAG: ABC transporter permease [Armatimonadota bacterium]|nr:ABC transporter permease [Armatimonadota bacterium]